MRRGMWLVIALACACKSQKTTAPTAPAPDAPPAADAGVLARDAPLAAPDAPPPDAPRPDAVAVDATVLDAGVDAPPEPDAAIVVLYRHSVEGTLVRLGGDAGVWAPLPGVTVTLECSRDRSPDDDELEQRCDSVLTVSRGGTELARAASGVAGLDWRAAGGNNGGLELSLFELESDSGAAFVKVRSWEQEGDERMHAETEDQLFAVSGEELVQVLRLTTRLYDEPGPDATGVRQELETELVPGKKKTAGLRNLIATERNVKSGRTRGVVTYVWNGSEYVDKKSMVHPIAMPDARP